MTDKPMNEDNGSVGMEAQRAGMNQKTLTPEKREELKALATVTKSTWPIGQWLTRDALKTHALDPVDAAFIAAANPATVLALISQAEAREGEIARLRAEASAANGRATDYRTVAINQGWNWTMCDAYGREAYEAHRGEHVDACALNAAEARARLTREGDAS